MRNSSEYIGGDQNAVAFKPSAGKFEKVFNKSVAGLKPNIAEWFPVTVLII